jgi:beta-glucuronidase
MLKYYHNHPSIIIWGMHNEIKSDTEEAYAMTKKYYTYLKEHGGDRIITYATDHPMTDICLEFCDIICINNYTGWYSGEIEEWSAFVEGFERRADDIGVGGKPIVFSEFGAAAIYGNHTFDDIRWTEEYQARLFEHCIELFHANDRVIGFYPWQMCDGRTAKEMGLNRARGYNNKGVLSEYRRPKAAYHTLARLYNSYKR